MSVVDALAGGVEAAWSRWDEHPGFDWTAIAMEDSCRKLAEYLDVPTSRLRDRLAEHRKLGRSRGIAVRAAIDDLTVHRVHPQAVE